MTYATVPELSVNELRILIREVVEETIVDLVVERGWSYLSESSLQNVWDNDKDAVYDDWRELYDVQLGKVKGGGQVGFAKEE